MPDNPTPDTTTPTPADLTEFDLDAFIAGAVTATKTVAIAQDRSLGEQIRQAQQDVIDLERRQANDKAEGRPSKRRAATAEDPDLEAARARLADLEEKAEGTYVFVRVEALTRAARKQALKDAKDAGGDVDTYNQSVLAHTAQIFQVDPRTHKDATGKMLTFDQWGEFAEAIGFMQWDALVDAAAEAAGTGVSPDFSQPASPSPGGGESSKS